MYIYFKLINAVLTCEEYPQIMSVENMKRNALENVCNKWEKMDGVNGTFTLSFVYEKEVKDFNNCENSCKEGDRLYLQNSGSIDIVYVNSRCEEYCKICEVEGYPNMYKWVETYDADTSIFALHVTTDNMLSDADVSEDIDDIQEYCHIEMVEYI